MWKCNDCHELIEDKYKFCWNCGSPQKDVHPESNPVKTPQSADEPASFSAADSSARRNTPLYEENVPFGDALPYEDKPSSKIIGLLPVVLWLAAFAGTVSFIYFAYQKRNAFEYRIREAAKNLNIQKDQFVFSKDALHERGEIQGKVLPINLMNYEVDSLFYSLPDDLRPMNPDEIKTVMWLDCNYNPVWYYQDDSVGHQKKCNAYLVDRETSKIRAIEDFLSEMPPLSKKWGTGDTYGEVRSEEYIAYLRSKQPVTEKNADRFASDSPDHHVYSKDELIYSLLLLGFLLAAGFGWLAYKVKFSSWDPD